MHDTIYALSSGQGRAGIAVVRVSGPGATSALKLLCAKEVSPRIASLRKLRDSEGQVIDEAMVLWFPSPHSATGEDVAEFHVHGSPALLKKLFAEYSRLAHFRLAAPGEFSRRAFANGKMDLVEVEGLADLLGAETEAQRRLAMRQFMGETSEVYIAWRNDILSALALHEAAIDFSDEDDVASSALDIARPILTRLREDLAFALTKADQASAVRSGLRVVIAGAPNVGKSSLLNALAGREAAIVSDIAGTTRDVVEAGLVLGGIPIVLADTAGLRESTTDAVEQIGIERASLNAVQADILVWVSASDIEEQVGPPRRADLYVQNKADLESIHQRNESYLSVSTKTGAGIDRLKAQLVALIHDKLAGSESAVIVRQRHLDAVSSAVTIIDRCLTETYRLPEIISEDLRRAARAIGSITGYVDVEDLLGKIFSEFCIGK